MKEIRTNSYKQSQFEDPRPIPEHEDISDGNLRWDIEYGDKTIPIIVIYDAVWYPEGGYAISINRYEDVGGNDIDSRMVNTVESQNIEEAIRRAITPETY